MSPACARDKHAAITDFVDALAQNGATRLVVLGMGGASLGGQVLSTLARSQKCAPTSSRQIDFVDNLDAQSFAAYLTPEQLRTTCFLAISKSGATSETLLLSRVVLSALKRAGLAVRTHFAMIVGAGDTELRQLIDADCLCFTHDPMIGGRFSIFTNVALVPAVWMGVDCDSLIEAADNYFAPLRAGVRAQNFAPAQGAAIQFAHMKRGRLVSFLLFYADVLSVFGNWYCQLWSESLGKDGGGSLAVAQSMPQGQHSQLQFYLDGSDIGFYTLLDWACDSECSAETPDDILALAQLVRAHARSTFETLVVAGRPVRHIHLASLDASNFGALLAHFIAETILTGDLMGCDVFAQMAVEAGKSRTRALMAGYHESDSATF